MPEDSRTTGVITSPTRLRSGSSTAMLANSVFVALGLPTLTGPYSHRSRAVMADPFLITLPIIIVFLIAQRRFIEALTSGAVKG